MLGWMFTRTPCSSRYYRRERRRRPWRRSFRWTQKYFDWLRGPLWDGVLEGDEGVFVEYITLEYKLQGREARGRPIEEIAPEPGYRDAVGQLRCSPGVDTDGAMVLTTEIGDFWRFDRACTLMVYVGLAPREHSTGDGSNAGTDHAGCQQPLACHHILVDAARSYRHAPETRANPEETTGGTAPGSPWWFWIALINVLLHSYHFISLQPQ